MGSMMTLDYDENFNFLEFVHICFCIYDFFPGKTIATLAAGGSDLIRP